MIHFITRRMRQNQNVSALQSLCVTPLTTQFSPCRKRGAELYEAGKSQRFCGACVDESDTIQTPEKSCRLLKMLKGSP